MPPNTDTIFAPKYWYHICHYQVNTLEAVVSISDLSQTLRCLHTHNCPSLRTCAVENGNGLWTTNQLFSSQIPLCTWQRRKQMEAGGFNVVLISQQPMGHLNTIMVRTTLCIWWYCPRTWHNVLNGCRVKTITNTDLTNSSLGLWHSQNVIFLHNTLVKGTT